jgi:hypothetical protein
MATDPQSGERVGQDARDFGMALALLVKHYEKPPNYMDVHRVRIYERGCEGIPGALLIRAAMRATKTRNWFPKLPELLEDAEACRQELIATMTFTPCAECEHSPGWSSIVVDGVTRATRCRCWLAYQERLVKAGVTQKVLAAPRREMRQIAEGNDAA